MAPEAACGHALAATCHPALVYTACGEHSSVGKKQRAQVAARRRSTRRVRQKVHEDGTRCARTEAGVREVRAGAARQRGGTGASACKSGMRRSAGVGGVAALGAGVTLLARARVVVGACRAP